MKFQPAILLITLHAGLALACIGLILLRKVSLRKEYIIPVIVLPIVGPAMVLVIALLNVSHQQGKTSLPIDLLAPDRDILWKALKSYHEIGDIVPLEEALLIDDMKTRRKFMLQTLYEDPLKYLDILQLAKNNEDVETSHYATTTISHAQRAFQLAIQQMAVEVDNNPEDMALLNKYVGTLGEYIESGLLEEHLLRNLRVAYKEVLDRKLAKDKNDKQALIRKLRNCIELREYASAMGVSKILRDQWPEDEQAWVETVRVCVEGKDQRRLTETLDLIRTSKIKWTKEGKEQVSAWMGSGLP